MAQINQYTPTTGVTAVAEGFPAIGGAVPPNSFRLDLIPARAESFYQVSPFIDLSQTYGSDNSRTVFLREYLSEDQWRGALGNADLEATVTDLTTGRLVNAGVSVNGEAASGIATWAQIKANAAKVGIILHDADIMAIPMVAFDDNGQLILDANGMPQLVALNKVTGEIVYVKDTNVADGLVLMTTKHAFLNDMGVRLPNVGEKLDTNGDGAGDIEVWAGRDLIDIDLQVRGQTINLKEGLDSHYIAGDGRLNENIGLTAVQEVFVNEHNRVVTLLKQQYGFSGEQPAGGWTWTDPLTNVTTKITAEELFQQAKLFNEMTYQHLVFDQFVRKLSPNIAGFAGVDPLIDARVSAEFAHAVYRLGHSMLPEAVGLRKITDASQIGTTDGSGQLTLTIANHGLNNGAEVTIAGVDADIGGIAAARMNGTFTITRVDNNTFTVDLDGTAATATTTGVATDKLYVDINRGLIEAFLNPQSYLPGYTAGLLAEGSTAQVGNRIDEKVTDALRDNLLGQPLDLATLNLVRGRDAGLPTLNEMRGSLQAVAPLALQPTLNPYTSWSNFRDNLKGTLADQNATVKNFIMAYASDDILTKFATSKTLAEWYALRESTVEADQDAYMAALKAAAETAFANATWMGTSGNKDFNRIDAWIGGLAEREVVGGMLGSTFDAVFAMQMMALQNGDSLYYLGRIPAEEFFIENMEGIQLSDIVMRSTGATNLYADIFSVADTYIQMDAAQQRVANFAALQASTTTEQVFDINGNVITASIGRAGYVGTTFYGNPGNYVDARGVLNPNGVGNASEMIAGTAANDTIIALGGNDTVRAGAGNDTIEGGSGVDFLYGGDGNDTIDGGTEDDFLYGEAGNDTMRGGIGIDTMFGSDGNDTMYGGLDADVMIGGTGNDIMYGGDGVTDAAGILDPDSLVGAGLIDDTMNGGQGDDTLYGGGGWDSLNGDSGHDLLIPGSGGLVAGGREAMDGGQGDDIYIIESIADFASHDIADSGLRRDQLVNKTIYRDQDATRTANGTANGIAIDEVRFTQTTPGDIILAGTNPAVPGALPSLFTGIERVVIGTGRADTADRTGTAAINIDASLANPGLNEGLEIWGNAGSNIIVGTAFDDVIDGGGGADTMEGGLGNDRYVLDQADDIVIEGLSGGGNDTIVVAGNFNYTLADDIENLTLQGTNNNQDGTGNALDNILIGSGSANRLLGLAGNDTIDGGGGDDTIIGGAGVDRLTGGDGNDTFIFASMAEIGNTASFRETITDFRPQGRTDLDLLDLTAIDADTGTAGHQSFNYANILSSGDSTNLQAGQLLYVNGVLYGGTNGSAGADFQIALNNGPTSLTRAMFVENPTLSIAKQGAAATNEGNTGTVNHVFTVTLSRAVSVDTTVDWSVSHTGDTALNATDFVVNNNVLPQGTLTILAGQTSGTITIPVRGDTIVEANETFQVTLSNSSGVAVIGTASATSTITNDDSNAVINGTDANNTLNGTAQADVINGLGGNDTLNGNAGNDVMNGGTGNDTLNGGDGNDTLDGGTGTDILNGGNGNDLLIGSAGRDTMTGGADSDTFRFNASVTEIGNLTFGFSFSNDQITDFTPGQDVIDLSAIDANTSIEGDQTFDYIGSAAFSGLGQLRYQNGQLQGNVTGSNAADFTISITNNPATLTNGDFIL